MNRARARVLHRNEAQQMVTDLGTAINNLIGLAAEMGDTDKATDYIIQMHMDLGRQDRDGDGAMDVLHRLLVAKVQIQRAASGEVQP